MNLKCQFIRILLKERNNRQVCHQASVVFLLRGKKKNKTKLKSTPKHSYIWKFRPFSIVILAGFIIINISYRENKNFWCFPLLWGQCWGGKLSSDFYDFAYLCYYIKLLSCGIFPDASGFEGEARGGVWVVPCSKASADFSWSCQIQLPLHLWGLHYLPALAPVLTLILRKYQCFKVADFKRCGNSKGTF